MPPTAWVLRGAWVALPAALGPPLGGALDGWTGAPSVTAEALLWTTWALGLLALLAPRPSGLTLVRLGAAWSLGVAVVSAAVTEDATVAAPAAVALATLAVSLSLLPEVAEWMVNATAYGRERRLPLRHPPVIAVVLAPLATALVGTAVALGPLLVAAGRPRAGALALVGGVVAVPMGRSLHALSRRWLVIVPGGLVLHDPLTLAHPVLLPRDHIAAVTTRAGGPSADAGDVDLRLGARGPGVHIALRTPTPLPVVQRNRRDVQVRPVTGVLVSVVHAGALPAR